MGTKKGQRRKTARRAYEFKTKKKRMSKKDAETAFRSKGMMYPDTEHNRRMMKGVVDDFLTKLRGF